MAAAAVVAVGGDIAAVVVADDDNAVAANEMVVVAIGACVAEVGTLALQHRRNENFRQEFKQPLKVLVTTIVALGHFYTG